MKKQSHTPGNWKVIEHINPSRTDYTIVAESELGKCDIAEIYYEAGDEKLGLPTEEEVEHHAHLFAAAPEMLEALEQFVFFYDQYRPKISVANGDDPKGFIENLDFKIERYREIITKAKGGAE